MLSLYYDLLSLVSLDQGLLMAREERPTELQAKAEFRGETQRRNEPRKDKIRGTMSPTENTVSQSGNTRYRRLRAGTVIRFWAALTIVLGSRLFAAVGPAVDGELGRTGGGVPHFEERHRGEIVVHSYRDCLRERSLLSF